MRRLTTSIPDPLQVLLAKAMKVLLHHLPARRGMPSTAPVNCDHFHISAHWKQCTEVSIEGPIQSHGDTDSALDRSQTPKAHSRRSESVNDDSIRGLTFSSENAQQRREESETSHDDFGNNSGNKITSKLWTPTKGPGQVGSRADSARDNIISDGPKDHEASHGDIGGNIGGNIGGKDDGPVAKARGPFHGGGGWGSSSFGSAGSIGLKNHETSHDGFGNENDGKDNGQVVKAGGLFHGGGGWGSSSSGSAGSIGLKDHQTFHEDIGHDGIDGKTPSKLWTPTTTKITVEP